MIGQPNYQRLLCRWYPSGGGSGQCCGDLYGIETSLWFDLRRLHCLFKRGRHLIGVDDPEYACCLNSVGAGAGQGILYMPAVRSQHGGTATATTFEPLRAQPTGRSPTVVGAPNPQQSELTNADVTGRSSSKIATRNKLR